MLNKKALAATAAAQALYVEDVFSSYLYTGNDSTQTITNGIDLSGEGGLVWIKSRNAGYSHSLFDTVRGANKRLVSNGTAAESTTTDYLTSFSSTGFSLGADISVNGTGVNLASWTFRQAEKFFDVVTYTGNGADNRAIAHNLGSTPGCVILKCTSTGSTNWLVQHRSVAADKVLILNGTNASFGSNSFSDQYADSTSFYVDNTTESNNNGSTYVAYLFAHDAGGFGDSGSDNVITCGSYTATGNDTINLGYEPQWILEKRVSGSGDDWEITDNMRGLSMTGFRVLAPNTSAAEVSYGDFRQPTATGYINTYWGSGTIIYIAIRRGPMKTPEAGTEVFKPVTRTGTGSATSITGVGFPPDIIIGQVRNSSGHAFIDKLRGRSRVLESTNTSAEATSSSTQDVTSFDQDGVSVGTTWNTNINASGGSEIDWFFRRAPGFFDVVCYTGNTTNRTIEHNLGVAPEMMIVKARSGTSDWSVYAASQGASARTKLNLSDAEQTGTSVWNSTAPTSSVFSLGTSSVVNDTGVTYVAYLFASVTGVSKVGSYTGNGSSQTINCGFTGGSRFVLIKRTDSTGDWVVFDSARGIVSGNDPYLELNTQDAEVTDKDAVDTDNTGFVVNETTGPNINTNGASYIYLAIA